MVKSKQIVVDTNVIVGLLYQNDPHHKVVSSTIKKLEEQKIVFFLNSLILSEICTVLLIRSKNKQLVQQTYDFLKKDSEHYSILPFSDDLEEKTYDIFHSQEKNWLSVADCSLIAQAQIEKVDTIYTIDQNLNKTLKQFSLKKV